MFPRTIPAIRNQAKIKWLFPRNLAPAPNRSYPTHPKHTHDTTHCALLVQGAHRVTTQEHTTQPLVLRPHIVHVHLHFVLS